MGCWNKTCGLSRLHIIAGTPVYVFVLEQNLDQTDRCYTTALFSPLLLPFEAVYNDYGGADSEDCSGVGLPYIINGLKESLVEMPMGENEYHDIPVTREKFDVDLFFNSVHESRLFISGFGDEKSFIDFVMIRKDVVENILNKWIQENYVGAGKGDFGYNNSYIRYSFKDVLNDIPAYIELLKEKIQKSVYSEIFLSTGFTSVVDYENRQSNKVSYFVNKDGYRYSRIVNIHSTIVELIKTGKMDEAAEMLKMHVIASFIDNFYNITRNVWIPGCHEGSQENQQDGYRVLASTINLVLDKEAEEDL